MRYYLLIITTLGLTFSCYGQLYNKDKICKSDTVYVEHISIKTFEPITFKAVECTQVSKIGFRFDLGIAKYYYNDRTKDWLGNHYGSSVGLFISFQQLNIGFRFKPWTVNPKSVLVFNSDTLPLKAKLNPIKFDYFIGYSIDFRNISVEPYFGLTRNVFEVINQDELGKEFDIKSVNGIIGGFSFNKYFRIKEYQFISAFLNVGYATANFSKTNNNLANGYWECAVGIAYKGFGKRRFYERLKD